MSDTNKPAERNDRPDSDKARQGQGQGGEQRQGEGSRQTEQGDNAKESADRS